MKFSPTYGKCPVCHANILWKALPIEKSSAINICKRKYKSPKRTCPVCGTPILTSPYGKLMVGFCCFIWIIYQLYIEKILEKQYMEYMTYVNAGVLCILFIIGACALWYFGFVEDLKDEH